MSAARTLLDLLIVGGGPAGMMAGLLFARAGCRVRVLEKHADFFRDFRGDTVHPSTMESAHTAALTTLRYVSRGETG
jgi:2-polyprenyl-6-methoxyphenol hydroxylase-like FAD-dependent oxidoreductase